MIIKEIKPEPGSKGIRITPKLFYMIIAEVSERLVGIKKGGPFNETLGQIVLNKYTVLKLEKNKNKEK